MHFIYGALIVCVHQRMTIQEVEIIKQTAQILASILSILVGLRYVTRKDVYDVTVRDADLRPKFIPRDVPANWYVLGTDSSFFMQSIRH